MAKKRGGLAGLYDRNKGLIRTASTIGASLLGGPGAGAAVGAAFRGLDRPGQRGIGFDVGQGARGAMEGYSIGSMTKGAQAGLGKLFGAKTAAPALDMGTINADIARGMGGGAPGATGAAGGMGGGMGGGMPADLPGMDMTPGFTPSAMSDLPIGTPRTTRTQERGGLRRAVGSGLKKAAKAAPEYQKTAEMIMGALPSPETAIKEREAAVLEARQALEQAQFDEALRQQRLMEQRQSILAELFIPTILSGQSVNYNLNDPNAALYPRGQYFQRPTGTPRRPPAQGRAYRPATNTTVNDRNAALYPRFQLGG